MGREIIPSQHAVREVVVCMVLLLNRMQKNDWSSGDLPRRASQEIHPVFLLRMDWTWLLLFSFYCIPSRRWISSFRFVWWISRQKIFESKESNSSQQRQLYLSVISANVKSKLWKSEPFERLLFWLVQKFLLPNCKKCEPAHASFDWLKGFDAMQKLVLVGTPSKKFAAWTNACLQEWKQSKQISG